MKLPVNLHNLFVTSAIAGYATFSQPAAAVPGSLDADFGNEGKVVTPQIGDAPGVLRITKVVILADGKILVGGLAVQGRGGIALPRYNTNGSLDSSFGKNGTVTSYLAVCRTSNS